MEKLTSYRLEHLLPFSPDVYFRQFELHNEAFWPVHVIAALLALAILWRAWVGDGRSVAALLAPAWLFVGWAFFVERYADLLWAAPYMGGAFIVQGALLGGMAALDKFELPARPTIWTWLGLAIALLGLVALPFVAPLAGRDWLGVEIFGIAPDPTVVTTLGLVVAARTARSLLLAIPLLWCLIAAATALAMDFTAGMITAAVGGVVLVLGVAQAITSRQTTDQ